MYEILKDTLEYLEEDLPMILSQLPSRPVFIIKNCIISVITYLIINTPHILANIFTIYN